MQRVKRPHGIKCIHCGRELDHDEGWYTVADLEYCEICYDDLFVSWKEAYERTHVR